MNLYPIIPTVSALALAQTGKKSMSVSPLATLNFKNLCGRPSLWNIGSVPHF